jgi:hypothetical protein
MRDMHDREMAQLGLKYIEDAVVNLLTRHDAGMTAHEIAEALELDLGRNAGSAIRNEMADGILRLLVATGRIRRDEEARVYMDNPDML